MADLTKEQIEDWRRRLTDGQGPDRWPDSHALCDMALRAASASQGEAPGDQEVREVTDALRNGHARLGYYCGKAADLLERLHRATRAPAEGEVEELAMRHYPPYLPRVWDTGGDVR